MKSQSNTRPAEEYRTTIAQSSKQHPPSKQHTPLQQAHLLSIVSELRKRLQQVGQVDQELPDPENTNLSRQLRLGSSGDSQTSHWIDPQTDPWADLELLLQDDSDNFSVDGLDVIQINPPVEEIVDDQATDCAIDNAIDNAITVQSIETQADSNSLVVFRTSSPDDAWEGDAYSVFNSQVRQAISTGCATLDRWFPEAGMRPGSIVEIISPPLAGGATHFSLILAKKVCGDDGLLVVIDRRHDFYPAMLKTLGFDLQNVLIVRPENDDDHLWALEQSLADPSVAAVWTRIETLDNRYQRRWQLAAQRSGAIGFLHRPESVMGHPTWALAQLQIRPNPYSSILTSNQRSYQSRFGFNSVVDHRYQTGPSLTRENWILDVTAVRCRGLFEQPTIRVEIHNTNMHESLPSSGNREHDFSFLDSTQEAAAQNMIQKVNASQSAKVESVFLTERLPHPNDPSITKPNTQTAIVPVNAATALPQSTHSSVEEVPDHETHSLRPPLRLADPKIDDRSASA